VRGKPEPDVNYLPLLRGDNLQPRQVHDNQNPSRAVKMRRCAGAMSAVAFEQAERSAENAGLPASMLPGS
jgi:hypothetical protein